MRHLLDTYIQADASEVVSDFEDAGLIDLIVKMGAGAIEKLPEGIKKNPEAVAETITNNMRKVIIDERPMNPKYYDRMSELLDALIEERRKGALEYQAYLAKLLDAAKKLGTEESETKYPAWANNGARRALVEFLSPDEDLAVEIDGVVLRNKPHGWVGNSMKERVVRNAIRTAPPKDYGQLDELFELVKARDEYR